MSQTIQDRRERQKAAQRDELLKAAHELVQKDGYEGLTIRKLATRAGYAPMSVYSYFADKRAILVALAEDHFALLARRLNRDFSADPVDALREGLLEYVDFALESPNEYRTIFMSAEMDEDATEFAEREASNPALRILIDRVEAAVAAGRLRGDTHAIATMLWTVAHGAISLLITFPHYPFGEPREYAERVIAVALLGLSAAEVEPLADIPPRC